MVSWRYLRNISSARAPKTRRVTTWNAMPASIRPLATLTRAKFVESDAPPLVSGVIIQRVGETNEGELTSERQLK